MGAWSLSGDGKVGPTGADAKGRDTCYSGTSMGQAAARQGPLNKSLAAA